MATIATAKSARASRSLYKILYVQVLIAILIGIVVRLAVAVACDQRFGQGLGDGFIKLTTMLTRRSSSALSCPGLPILESRPGRR